MNLHQRLPSPSYQYHMAFWRWFHLRHRFQKDFYFHANDTDQIDLKFTRDIFLNFMLLSCCCLSTQIICLSRQFIFILFSFYFFPPVIRYMFDVMYSFVDIESKQCRKDNCCVDWFVLLVLNSRAIFNSWILFRKCYNLLMFITFLS